MNRKHYNESERLALLREYRNYILYCTNGFV